jgi:hypothetical protein
VRRETFAQSLSLSISQAGYGYHWHKSEQMNGREVTVDPDRFVAQCKYQSAMLDYEDLLFSEIPHIVVQYETDLKTPLQHQNTIDRICAYLDLPSSRVSADLKKMSDHTVVTNIDVLRACVESLNPAYRSIR